MATDPFDYAARFGRQIEPRTIDPVSAEIERMKREEIGAHLDLMPEPERIARETRAAREAGVQPLLVQDALEETERANQTRRFLQVSASNSAMARWALQNPRGAAAAQDDSESLGILGGAWDFLKNVPGRFFDTGMRGAARMATTSSISLQQLWGEIESAPAQVALRLIGRGDDVREIRSLGRGMRQEQVSNLDERLNIGASRARYSSASPTVNALLTGVESVPLTIAAAATRNPFAGAGVIGTGVGLQSVQDAQSKGLAGFAPWVYGAAQGTPEALFELLPMGELLKVPGRNLAPGFARYMAAEVPGEMATTLVQSFTDWTMLPENADKPFGDWVDSLGEAEAQTVLSTLGGGTITVGATSAMAKVAGLADKARQSRQAKAERQFIDRAERAAESSKLRQRDPEAFRQLLREQAEEAGARDVFIPGEAVRAFQQSDRYNPDADPFAAYDIDEAVATGGDIVVPIEDALTDLVGTPAWGAVRDDVRLAPGGMSAREAQTFDEAMEDLMAEMGEQAAEQDKAQAAERTTREKIVDRVAEMFGVSFTSPTARTIAELFAQRAQARAARLGQELSEDALAGFEVRQVMPEGVVQAVKADTLDLVINAMRQRGEIEQGGSTIADLDDRLRALHEKAGFVPDSIRESMADMEPERAANYLENLELQAGIETNPRSIPEDIDARVEALAAASGKEVAEVRSALDQWVASHGDTAAMNAFEAAELHQSLLESVAAGVDNIRAAAADLRAMLEDAGLNPDEMSDAEIREAVEGMTSEETEGRALQQLPDTIEINGEPKPTRNSLGQPLAGSAAGVRAFWAWFGNSKVVDAEGRPLVVYHGSNQPIEQFSVDRLGMTTRSESARHGFFFTSDPQVAAQYADMAASRTVSGVDEFERQSAELQAKVNRLERQAIRTGNWDAYEAAMSDWENLEIEAMRADDSGQNTTPVYLAISDPTEIDFEGESILRLEGGFGDAIAAAREGGRDGLILRNIDDTPNERRVSDHYVTFRPAQIKSINNRGTFDPADPRILHQSDMSDNARGRIVFDGNRRIIELFQSRNLSTPLHELSHMWLEELRFDAEQEGAPEQLKADWETAKAYFAANGHKIGEDGQIPTEAHELWARSGERYFMEGKAPTSALVRLFEQFRAWLVNIYKTVDRLRAPITPEIREVFDRLLATDEEIAAARERQGLEALFKDAASVGMTETEFRAYQGQVDNARAGAHASLLDKTMRTIRRREQERYSEARKAIRAEEAERIDAAPLYRAISMMREQRVSKEWIADTLGLDALDLLPVRVPPLYVAGGIHPDVVAEQAGYPGGEAMIEALIGAERAHREAKEAGDDRSMRQRAIEEATNAEFARRYGDPLNDGSIEREALAAVHSEMQGEVIASELRVLSRRTGQRPTPYRLAREWARGKIRTGTVAQEASPSAIQRYARNAAKAGREAEQAMLKQDADEAFRQKQFQMMNNALVAEAKAAADEIESAVKRMDKIARAKTRKSVDQDYLEQAQALLEVVDLRPRSQVSIDRQGQWEAFAEAREAEGFDVVVPASFEATINRTHWSRLSVENLLALDEAVKQVIHLGRLKQTLLDNQEQREWDEIYREVETGADNIGRKPPKGGFTDPTWWDSIKSRAATVDAALLKMEQVFDWLDQGNSNGVFNRVVFRPIAEAQAREQDMTRDYFARMREALESVPAETIRHWGDKIALDLIDPATGLPAVFERKKLVAMALNWGNAGNRQRLADGYGWSPAGIEAALMENLTEAEWQFVQKTWDIIDTLWPEIEAMERAINGVAPEKVEAAEVVTPFGTLRGGYYPAIYDTALDYTAEEQAGRKTDLFEAKYTKATTRASATKERMEKVSRPILLDLGVINRHLGEVIHDVTHREAVMRAHKFLTNSRTMKAVDETLGPEVRKQFRPWLQHVANSWAQDRVGNEGIGKFMSKARANTTVVGMGWRFTTMLTQIAGYSNSFEHVGAKWVSAAIAQSAAHPIETFDFVMSRSGEMRGRMDTIDRDIRAEMNRMESRVGAAAGRLTAAKRFAFHGIGYMDRVVSVPTWLGAYNKAISEGMTEEEAAYAGDKAIRLSQGAAGPKDLAAVATGQGRYGEALKWLTMFYSYLSTVYSRQRNLGRDVRRASPRDLPALMARAWWLIVVPPLLAEILSGRGPDDDEDAAWWAFKKMLSQSVGAIPLVRDLTEPVLAGIKGDWSFGYRLSPVQAAGESVQRVAKDIGKIREGKDTTRATRNVLEMTGYFTGLVPGQVAASTQFLVDVGSGDADPETISDWYTGLTKGRVETADN